MMISKPDQRTPPASLPVERLGESFLWAEASSAQAKGGSAVRLVLYV